MFAFVVAILTVYRITLALYKEAGPFNLLEKWHNLLESNSHQFNPGFDGNVLRTLRELFECYYCLSLWVALPVTVALALYSHNWFMLLSWPALSGGAIALMEVTNGKQ